MKEKEIIDYYLNAKDKKKAIQDIKKETGLSIQEIYRKLRKNNILPPTKFENNIKDNNEDEEDEWEDDEDDTNNDDKPEVLFYFDDSEINPDSIIPKFKAMGWLEKENAQRVINISNYIEDTYGIDVWESYINYLIWMLNSLESKQLESDIKAIKERSFQIFDTPQTKREKIEKEFYDQMLETLIEKPDMVKESIIEPQPEPQQQGIDFLSNLIMLTNPKMFGLYKMITDNEFRDRYIDISKQFKQINKLLKSKNPDLIKLLKKSEK